MDRRDEPEQDRQQAQHGTTAHSDAHQSRARIASIVHDLRGPLATIASALETVLERWADLEPELRRELLTAGLRNARELDQRIGELLGGPSDRTRTEPPRPAPPRRLRALVETVLEGCAGPLAAHEVDVSIDPGLSVRVDPRALFHILENLLINAAQHSGTGSTITVRGSADGDRVVVEVADSGPGMEAAMRARAFEPHVSGRPGGTGLGLAIVRRHVEAAGGRVWIEPGPGGTTVRFTLPAG